MRSPKQEKSDKLMPERDPKKVPKGAGKLKGLRSGLNEAQLQKYYLRFLHGTREPDALRALLTEPTQGQSESGSGALTLRDPLSKREIKQLKKLLKRIKRNKKSVKAIKLAGFTILIAALVLFNIFFKNRLVEWGIEKGISSLTGASVECDQAYLSWRGQIGFARLAVANPNDLRLNLIELGPTQLDISLWQLFSRKVVINEIRGEHLRWNTQRQTVAVRTRPSRNQADGSTGLNLAAVAAKLSDELGSAGLSPESLLKRAEGQFPSIQAASELEQQISEAENWPGKLEQHKNQIEGLVREIQAIDLNSITVENAPRLLQQGQALAPKVEKLVGAIDRDLRALEQQIRTITGALDTIVRNFEQDLAKFKGQIASGELLGSPFGSYLQQYLHNKLAGIGLLNGRAMQILQRYRQLRQKNSGEEDGLKQAAVQADRNRQGRNYYFPSTAYPKFVIRRIFFSLGDEQQQPYLRFDVRDIADDADVMGYPIQGQYLGADGGVETEVRFLLENRSRARPVANCRPLLQDQDICPGLRQSFVQFELRKQHFALPPEVFEQLQMPYIQSYQALMRSKLRLEAATAGESGNIQAVRGILQASIYQPELQRDSTLDLPQSIIVSVLENNDVELEASFTINEAGAISDLQLQTNIESILKRELQRLQQAALELALSEAEKLLRQQFGVELEPLRKELADLQQYLGILNSQDRAALSQEKFSSGIEARIKAELEKQKEVVAKKAAEALAKEAEKILPPSLPVKPSLPRLPF